MTKVLLQQTDARFALTLKKVLSGSGFEIIADEMRFENRETLGRLNNTILILDSEIEREVQKWFDVLRRKLKSCAPFIVLGYQYGKTFEESNKAFYEKHRKYIYLRKPLNLLNFLNCLRNAQPLYNGEECRRDVFRYSNPLGRILDEVYNNLNHGEFRYSISYLRKQAEQMEASDGKDLSRNVGYMLDKFEAMRDYVVNRIEDVNECDVPDSSGTEKLRVSQVLSNIRSTFEEITKVLRRNCVETRVRLLLALLDRLNEAIGKINELRFSFQER